MKKNTWKLILAVMIAGIVLVAPVSIAQSEDEATENAADEAATEEPTAISESIVVLGSRSSEPRSITDSPVPIDIIQAEDFNALGNSADLTDNLRTLVPSYTATPATGDGSAFVRPTSLRGSLRTRSWSW